MTDVQSQERLICFDSQTCDLRRGRLKTIPQVCIAFPLCHSLRTYIPSDVMLLKLFTPFFRFITNHNNL